jgi:hypothetical protein
MLRQEYFEFVNSFGELSPYELDHLCEALYRKLNQLTTQKSANNGERLAFNEQDLKHILIKTMIEVRVVLAELRKEEAEQQLKLAKAAASAAGLSDIKSNNT